MIAERLYRPTKGEKLYHYCSPESFLAIARTRRLRLADLYAMNDSMEMHWGYRVWEAAATELLPTTGKEFLDHVDLVFHEAGARALFLATCLSTSADVLSQWRAYAQDGIGYSLGFNAEDLCQLAVRPLRVLYDWKQQIAEVRNAVYAIWKKWPEPKAELSDFIGACTSVAIDLAAMKNPAFCEEAEVRLVHIVHIESDGDARYFQDRGGYTLGKKSDGEVVSFFMRGGTPVAHIDVDYTANLRLATMQDVVLGPKNDALAAGVGLMLGTLGFRGVGVRKSAATYR
ncbi:DUF2971 domain-containing protein [Roseateles microcysteis]|uniref:DUF2971 domain-containing protein n=1 Tax=Roseateles microcysteis TaxID=3119057 RepID=UPI002FE5EE52